MNKQLEVAGFPITDDMSLKRRGEHFDLVYEVANHGRNGFRQGGTWCYYVIVGEYSLEPESFAEFWLAPSSMHKRSSGMEEPVYSYYEARFAGAEWHGGVTFYEKFGGIDGQARAVRIGCDFAHLWDEGHEYEFQYVESEARRTIEALREMYTFKRRCWYTGRWLPEAQMLADENGKLLSPEGKAFRDERARQATAHLVGVV